jgi:cyanophycin synthetase
MYEDGGPKDPNLSDLPADHVYLREPRESPIASRHSDLETNADLTIDGDPAAPAGKMRVLEARVYRGPNPYGYRPVIRMKLDIGPLEAHPTTKLPGFVDRLLDLIPTLQKHGCSYGKRGGFEQRMREGTWAGHVAEHIAIELQCLAATPVTYGKTRAGKDTKGVYNVVYSYKEEHVGLLAGWLALRIVNHLLPPELRGVEGLDLLIPDGRPAPAPNDAPLEYCRELEALIRLAERSALGPTTQSLVDEARRRDIPALRLDCQSLVQLGYGKHRKLIRASVTGETSHIALETAQDKELTIRMLRDAGIPVPKNVLVRSEEEVAAAAQKIGYPVVTKPLDVSHGRGVSINLANEEQVRWGYQQSAAFSRSVLVEQFLQGHDYRVLVIGGEVVACAQRIPAHVRGDGQHTIGQLIEIVNRDPRRGIGHEKVMTRITVDAQAGRLLARAGYTLDTVLAEGEVFYLRSTANMSTGGTAIDRTNEMHPENADIARRAAMVIGLDVAGIDIIAPDITKSVRETGGGIVEVNAGPGFRMHLQPSEGKPRNVARPVIDMLFPPGTTGRVPIISITGTNGKTTTTRMVAHILKMCGKTVGMTTSTGIFLDGREIMHGDLTGPKSARIVLRDPTVDVAVFETARGGILREGLGFDRCDVGAVLNIQEDHLGLKGVDTLEDLAWVKSLVVETVREDGVSVLNADDPLTYRMRRRAEGRIIYFSMHGGRDGNDYLRRHIAHGSAAVVLESGVQGDMIVIYDGDNYQPLMWTHQIPATLEGAARFNVQNALAAAAIAYGLKIPVDTIRMALASFVTTFEQNPGRLNVYDGHPFRVILDYAHNPNSMEQIADMVARMRSKHKRVIAVLTGTGDRRDQDIRRLGEIAGKMVDELIVRETSLLRGREPGVVPRLVMEGARAAGLRDDQITYIDAECPAIEAALRKAQPGDLVFVFCDDSTLCWERIRTFRPERGADQIPCPQAA